MIGVQMATQLMMALVRNVAEGDNSKKAAGYREANGNWRLTTSDVTVRTNGVYGSCDGVGGNDGCSGDENTSGAEVALRWMTAVEGVLLTNRTGAMGSCEQLLEAEPHEHGESRILKINYLLGGDDSFLRRRK